MALHTPIAKSGRPAQKIQLWRFRAGYIGYISQTRRPVTGQMKLRAANVCGERERRHQRNPFQPSYRPSAFPSNPWPQNAW
jgi:hypothetical protein